VRNDTLRELDAIYARHPTLKAGELSDSELQVASAEIGLSFPEDYREFLLRYGAAIVGPYPIFGLRDVEPMGAVGSVVDINDAFHRERPDLSDWLIFSNDLAGNPIGLLSDGSVWLADHEFGEIVRQADGFEDFIRGVCLKL